MTYNNDSLNQLQEQLIDWFDVSAMYPGSWVGGHAINFFIANPQAAIDLAVGVGALVEVQGLFGQSSYTRASVPVKKEQGE